MKILVPTDFSKNSKNAIEYAAHIAKAIDAEIILLHVWSVVPTASELESISVGFGIEFFAESSEANLKLLVEEFQKRYPVFTTPISREGFAPKVIKEVVKELDIDLVVVGSRGLGGFGRAILGSVSRDVFADNIRPLLIVPKDAIPGNLHRFVFATDFHDSDLSQIRFLTEIAKSVGASLTVIHFHLDTDTSFRNQEYFEAYEKSIRSEVRYSGLDFQYQECGNIHEALESYVSEKGISLISMAGVQRSFWEGLVVPSFTSKALKSLSIPMLAFSAIDEPSSYF